MNPVGASVFCIIALLVVVAPRRWSLLGMMAGVLYLTQRQQLVIGGLNLFAIRLLGLMAFARVLARREFSFGRLNGLDKSLVGLYAFATLVFLLRSKEGLAFQIGLMVDTLLGYFAFRGLIQNKADFVWLLRGLAVLLIPYVVMLAVERMTLNNLFSILGGGNYTWIRDGKLRCMGSFRHPSLLGTLGASFFPLYVGLFFSRPDRMYAKLGIALSVLIVLASNSGGPMNALFFGVVGWMLWGVRARMQMVRRCLLASVVILHLVMKAPVWYLLAKSSALTGGDGWHRAYLIDMAVNDLGKWWLAGMPLAETSDWFPYTIEATGAADITNQFIAFGLTAGLGATALLILMLSRAFRWTGHAMQVERSQVVGGHDERFLWGLGVMVIVHIVTWFGIIYFDQTYILWLMQFAALSAITEGTITGMAGSSSADRAVEDATASVPASSLAATLP